MYSVYDIIYTVYYIPYTIWVGIQWISVHLTGRLYLKKYILDGVYCNLFGCFLTEEVLYYFAV